MMITFSTTKRLESYLIVQSYELFNCDEILEQAIDSKRKEDLLVAKRPLVHAAVVDSEDWKSISYFQQDFVLDLEKLVEELCLQSQMAQAAMEATVPFCKQFFNTAGNSVPFESPHGKTSHSTHDIMVKNTKRKESWM